MYRSAIDSGALPGIALTLENHLNSYFKDDKNVISALSDTFGATALGSPGSKGYMSQDEIAETFGSYTSIDALGNETTTPRFYDENGDAIQLTKTDKGNTIDPLVFTFDANGRPIVTEDQRNIAKALQRDRTLKALDVKLFEWKDRAASTRKDSDFTGSTLFVSAFQTTTSETSDPTRNHYLAAATANAAYSTNQNAIADGFVSAMSNGNYGVFASNQDIQDNIPSSIQSLLKKKENNLTAVSFGRDIGKQFIAATKLSDASGHVMQSVSNYAVVHDDKNNFKGILIQGTSLVAKSKDEYELYRGTTSASQSTTSASQSATTSRQTGKEGIDITEQKAIVSPAVVLLTPDQYPTLYDELWRDNDTQVILSANGFDKNGGHKDMGRGQYRLALETLANYYKEN